MKSCNINLLNYYKAKQTFLYISHINQWMKEEISRKVTVKNK